MVFRREAPGSAQADALSFPEHGSWRAFIAVDLDFEAGGTSGECDVDVFVRANILVGQRPSRSWRGADEFRDTVYAFDASTAA